ncbi:Fungalysin metallopeptidase-domain-containing protein [Chytridium lagenaria]|nr:Fungalysin metallopeptidase-domain-containing protein [Chytridium lagenaria]
MTDLPISTLRVSNSYTTPHNNLHHVYITLVIGGVPVINVVSSITISANNTIIAAHLPHIDPQFAHPVGSINPTSVLDAVREVAGLFGGKMGSLVLSTDGKRVRRRFYYGENGMEPVYEIEVKRDEGWYRILVSSSTSQILAGTNLMNDGNQSGTFAFASAIAFAVSVKIAIAIALTVPNSIAITSARLELVLGLFKCSAGLIWSNPSPSLSPSPTPSQLPLSSSSPLPSSSPSPHPSPSQTPEAGSHPSTSPSPEHSPRSSPSPSPSPSSSPSASPSPSPQPGPVYLAIPFNVEALPGGLQLMTSPAILSISLQGWHTTQSTNTELITSGNNVHAILSSTGSTTPSRNNQRFDYTYDATRDPTQSIAAVVSNVFVVTNLFHDILYQYGFTESAGNFQINNFDRDGQGNDAIRESLSETTPTPARPTRSPPPATAVHYITNYYHDLMYKYGFNEASANLQTNNFGKGGKGNDAINEICEPR